MARHSESTEEAILEIKDYSFWYVRQAEGKRFKTLALDKVNLTINRGEFVLMIGPTSCGKTTLCLNILGILPDLLGGQSTGEILLNDGSGLINRQDIPKEKRFLLANMVSQDPNDQMVSLTVEDEVAFALENYLFSAEEIVARMDEALEIVGMSKFKHNYVSTLSGGEKQRVAIAAMLALRPQLLILDQPTSNLDPAGSMEVLETISNIRDTLDITILLVEHPLDGIFEKADKVILFNDKTIEYSGTPRGLIDTYGLDLIDKYGLWMPQAAQVGVCMRNNGLTVDTVPITKDEIIHALKSVEFKDNLTGPNYQSSERIYEQDSDEIALSLKNLYFSYPTRDNVLQDISFDIKQGEFVAVLGQNGSGKTTMISHLPGILKPTKGDVLIKGLNTKQKSIQELAKHVAYVFQYPDRQFICNSVEDELAHGLKSIGTATEKLKEATETFLRRIELWDHRHEHPYGLSHGQKRRLSVACMLIYNPEIVILDEPTFGLDHRQVTSLMDFLYDLATENKTAVIFVTHDMRLVVKYAQRAIVLYQSKLIFDGPPRELFLNNDILLKTNLQVPPVLSFSREAMGECFYQPEDLIKFLPEV